MVVVQYQIWWASLYWLITVWSTVGMLLEWCWDGVVVVLEYGWSVVGVLVEYCLSTAGSTAAVLVQ